MRDNIGIFIMDGIWNTTKYLVASTTTAMHQKNTAKLNKPWNNAIVSLVVPHCSKALINSCSPLLKGSPRLLAPHSNG
jgi:hypothetical protein